ncbi:MAG: tRNA uridine-5-carboxymethylaminomethyl(34) synthesis GTPase MnmE [Pseudomonadota bacterium]
MPGDAPDAMSHSDKTIYALASGGLPCAVALIRISGSDVQEWSERHLAKGLPSPRQAVLSQILDHDLKTVDEAIVTFFPGPYSYTGEDVLEVGIHGGKAVVDHVFALLSSHRNCRLAGPGEFTRRAFEAGRIDLTRAEGIADLIAAETRGQKDLALAQAGGALADLYNGWRASLMKVLSLLEASIDFPDEAEAPTQILKPVGEALEGLMRAFETALRDGEIDQRIRDGFRVAIVGPPNAGKSTLLNYFAKRDAAIVTERPGTTRDVIEVRATLAGHVVYFLDTAGLRETDEPIEAEGIRRAHAAAGDADLRLHLFADGPSPPPLTDWREGDLAIRTKADLGLKEGLTGNALAISVLEASGMDALEKALAKWVSDKTANRGSPVLTRIRHREAILAAKSEIGEALTGLADARGHELVAENCRMAARHVASLVGGIDVEDVLGEVFSSFCIGK